MVFVICRIFPNHMRSLQFFSLFQIFLFSIPSLCLAQQISKVDFTSIDAEVTIHPQLKMVEGKASYKFNVLEGVDSLYIDARSIVIKEVKINGEAIPYNEDPSRLWLVKKLPVSNENIVELQYTARPKEAMYFINWNEPDSLNPTRQVWTQGQGKNNSHWLPGFEDMREKVIFSLKINFNKEYEVVSNGVLNQKRQLNDTLTQWHYTMDKPMSSYLLAIAAGKYALQEEKTKSGLQLYHFYRPQDRDLVEPTYRHTKFLFDFFEQEIGVSYPWQNYKQVPVQDFLYSGMENTGATLFAQSLMVDETGFHDQNYVNVNAHELAHQWFGNYVTATNGDHHWLHEGFATFYALLAEKEIFGEDHYYWKLYQSAEELKALSDEGKGQALINSKASSLTYYQKGAWALHILREKIGEAAFKLAVKNFLKKYAYSNADTDAFLAEAEAASSQDLSEFKRDWLQQSAFQGTEALNSLMRSNFLTRYLELAGLREAPFEIKKELLNNAVAFPVNDYIGQEAVYQLAGNTGPEVMALYKKALETGNLYVRQAIATSLQEIPKDFKVSYEGLLEDPSYITKEHALMNLWVNFPEDAEKYLKKTQGVDGFSNKNVRMLWLVLNLVSPTVEPHKTKDYIQELTGYTGSHYPFEIRENAFGYLYQINTFSPQNLKDLLDAGQHHTFRFRDFARKLLSTLLKDPEYREKFARIEEELRPRDKEFLKTRLNMVK